MKIAASMLVICMLVTSCSYRPVVNWNGTPVEKNKQSYEVDLNECQSYAEGVNPVIAGIAGALFNAALDSLILGLLAAMNGGDVKAAAAVGAIAGGVYGASTSSKKAVDERRRIIDKCMQDKGYVIIQ